MSYHLKKLVGIRKYCCDSLSCILEYLQPLLLATCSNLTRPSTSFSLRPLFLTQRKRNTFFLGVLYLYWV